MQRHALKFSPRRLVTVAVVGAGGTGSSLLTALTDIHKCLLALGGQGLLVVAYDPSAVSSVNVVRQNDAPAEVGRNKAVSLVTRINCSLGTAWQGVPTACSAEHLAALRPQVLITCTDTRGSRRELGKAAANLRVPYWLDTGNAAHTGQVVLSEPGASGPHLPSPLETHSAFLKGDTEDGASCSALEALSRQDLMINREVALHAARLLWRLLCDGYTETRGCYIDTRAGQVMPVPVEDGMVRPGVVSAGLIAPVEAETVPALAVPRKRPVKARDTRPAAL